MRKDFSKEYEWFNSLSDDDKNHRYAGIFYERELLVSQMDKYYRYSDALDEIEEQVNKDIKRLSQDVNNNDYICDLQDILRIIEQAKDKNNDIKS